MAPSTLRVSSAALKHFEKTKLCLKFSAGCCPAGEKCPFAHGDEELREIPDLSKTNLCEAFMNTGVCSYGTRCTCAALNTTGGRLSGRWWG
eukprot:CAMPEP_0204324400 /NCGR_PEP_ID=MMETSP0469-20131031/10194_1 /ASSEMBLY_ACC=CAM_ASM_000384 /TAXON_ID=2969 /ORGANISM="Oxyrrhis marina" /LENGTH=90 /DNA_ID=CAMNT_0051306051 /DNA_START=36 /DNA_END=304 /DNA_ORIENTATION=-